MNFHVPSTIYGVPSTFLSDIESDSNEDSSMDYTCGWVFNVESAITGNKNKLTQKIQSKNSKNQISKDQSQWKKYKFISRRKTQSRSDCNNVNSKSQRQILNHNTSDW